jgi:aquaporin Z
MGIGAGGAFAIEWLLSFALMLVIVAVATDDRVAGGLGAIAVGLTVGFCAMMGGPLTGASMNPARSLGPALAGGFWDAHWVYWLAPITGMLAAARVYEMLRATASPRMDPGLHSHQPLGLEGPLDLTVRAAEAR